MRVLSIYRYMYLVCTVLSIEAPQLRCKLEANTLLDFTDDEFVIRIPGWVRRRALFLPRARA